jgi:hypothetical protein
MIGLSKLFTYSLTDLWLFKNHPTLTKQRQCQLVRLISL